MGLKERLQKELDLILEKIRFWRYVIFGIVSATIGMLFGASQNKFQLNTIVMIFLIFGLIGIIVSVKRISMLTEEYKYLLDKLERTE